MISENNCSLLRAGQSQSQHDVVQIHGHPSSKLSVAKSIALFKTTPKACNRNAMMWIKKDGLVHISWKTNFIGVEAVIKQKKENERAHLKCRVHG
jgi:hypothetical protein